MEKSGLVKLLSEIRISDVTETKSNISEEFEQKCEVAHAKLENYDCARLDHITKHYFSDPNLPEWKYILLNLYIMQDVGRILKNSKENALLLSVKETKIIKDTIADLTELGIYSKLHPKLPFHVKKQYTKTEDIFFEYNLLKCTSLAFCDLIKNEHLRPIVLTESLRAILTALYQIAHCPLSKNNTFTEDTLNKLMKDKALASDLLLKLKHTIHPQIYIKETMVIVQENAPAWFKKAASQMLTSIMLAPKGVENVALAMLDGAGNDKASTWRALDVLFRLISSCKNQPGLLEQVVRLKDTDNLVFERFYALCVKRFYVEDCELAREVLVRPVVMVLLRFVMQDSAFKTNIVTKDVKGCLRLLHAIFAEKTVESPCLPSEMLRPVLSVIFAIYSVTLNSALKATSVEAKEVLLKYLSDHASDDAAVFDNFLFGKGSSAAILPFRGDIELSLLNGDLVVQATQHKSLAAPSNNFEAVQALLNQDVKLLTRLFKYLLKCLVQRDKYFKKSNEGLLSLESDVMTEYFERSLMVFSALSVLADNRKVQKEIISSPSEIICFIQDVLHRSITSNTHKTTKFECDEFQTLFTVVMILNALLANHPKKSLETFKPLCEPLKAIQSETKHQELTDLIGKILINFDKESSRVHVKDKSKLDVILEDICDPLLPVRAHGIMALKKLVEQKDPAVMQKKQFVLTLFQQNLKNEDSYIYLSAVDGLAAMANNFSDSVINSLCEEYSDFSRRGEDGHEVRIKLGEVLVRVTKMLGEMAPKHKSILLNTFLLGTKDDDHLIRASSLSNLGEICRVLGYKLGTVVTEVLVCVHAVIATDKAIEARRAAVTVIRQLLAGLESEMVAFLKEEILPVYRTLKGVYRDDPDDVMRLQAQLALEELNENMKNFAFPTPELSTGKKIIMLN